MRFLILIALLALISGIMMGGHKKMKHYKAHKKVCMCVKKGKYVCFKLRCCDYYQYIPYKAIKKYCKYGKCKFYKHKHHGKHH